MDNEKVIDELNALMVINNDRVKGYKRAYDETKEEDLKEVFNRFMKTSIGCKQELSAEVSRLGGKPTHETKTTGKLYRIYMDLKATLTGDDRKAILSSCEYGEDMALQTYKDLLDNKDGISDEQTKMITSQYDLIKSDHDVIKSMRDDLAANPDVD